MIVEISSFSNPRIKFLKALAKSRNRKKEGVFLLEGRPELDHAFSKGLKPRTIAYCEYYISLEEIKAMTSITEDGLLKISKPVFDDLTYQNVPGNFLAVIESWDLSLEDLDPNKRTIILESIEKPGNLGAVLRTCDAFGIEQVIVANSEIDLFNPNVLRNSRGAIFNTEVVFCSNQGALEWIERHNVPTLAAVLSDKSEPYTSVYSSEVGALLFGAESKGLSDFWLKEERIKNIIIPMNGIVDSLNLSVSVAVLSSYYSNDKEFE